MERQAHTLLIICSDCLSYSSGHHALQQAFCSDILITLSPRVWNNLCNLTFNIYRTFLLYTKIGKVSPMSHARPMTEKRTLTNYITQGIWKTSEDLKIAEAENQWWENWFAFQWCSVIIFCIETVQCLIHLVVVELCFCLTIMEELTLNMKQSLRVLQHGAFSCQHSCIFTL